MDLSAPFLIVGLVASTIGFSLFLYGKRQMRVPQVVTGLVLMVAPFVVHDPLWLAATSMVILSVLVVGLRSGRWT